MGSVTAKQAAFITSLLAEREGYSEGFAARVNHGMVTAEMEAKKASEVIEWLLKLPKKAAAKAMATDATGTKVELTKGFWVSDATDGDGIDVWKVQESKKGFLYAKLLVIYTKPDGEKRGDFRYVPGGFKTLAANKPREFTLAEAQAYGKAYGVCARCGYALKKEDSVERMLGPTCYKKVMAKGHAL